MLDRASAAPIFSKQKKKKTKTKRAIIHACIVHTHYLAIVLGISVRLSVCPSVSPSFLC